MSDGVQGRRYEHGKHKAGNHETRPATDDGWLNDRLCQQLADGTEDRRTRIQQGCHSEESHFRGSLSGPCRGGDEAGRSLSL